MCDLLCCAVIGLTLEDQPIGPPSGSGSMQPLPLPHRKWVQSQSNRSNTPFTTAVLPKMVVSTFGSSTQHLRTSADDTAALKSSRAMPQQQCTNFWCALLITTTRVSMWPHHSSKLFWDVRLGTPGIPMRQPRTELSSLQHLGLGCPPSSSN